MSSLSYQGPVSAGPANVTRAGYGSGYGVGYGSGGGAAASADSAAAGAVSRLSSSSDASRVFSALSSILSSAGINLDSLSNASRSVAESNPGLSEDDVLVQTLLEVVSALVHALSNSNIGYVDVAGQSAS
ncbi:spidroin-2-like [Panonychus citri]|uniref:spidroin-2-like n=1 Tax=Panonychus citri TaxID=50023 RepID=UPI002307E340|nr:spidroin-2-like [Panonychus citri]